jgi:hypothetical protein
MVFEVGAGADEDAPMRMVFGPGAKLQPEQNRRFSAAAVVESFNPDMADVDRIAESRFESGMTERQRRR